MNHHITASLALLAPADALSAADNKCPKQPLLLNQLLRSVAAQQTEHYRNTLTGKNVIENGKYNFSRTAAHIIVLVSLYVLAMFFF